MSLILHAVILSFFLQVNTLWGSFEISNVRLAKVMMSQFAGYIFSVVLAYNLDISLRC